MARSHQRDTQVILLKAHLATIDARIDLLRERGAIGSEEAEGLRKQARRLQSRLHALSTREAADVAFGIDRLETRVGFAMDDARWGTHAYGRFEGYLGDAEPYGLYESNRNRDYENFDRYTGSPVDRWHDPFDRGN
jgi:hypothetical protein